MSTTGDNSLTVKLLTALLTLPVNRSLRLECESKSLSLSVMASLVEFNAVLPRLSRPRHQRLQVFLTSVYMQGK